MISSTGKIAPSRSRISVRLWLIAACVGLLLLGFGQGDYHETLLNGTAL